MPKRHSEKSSQRLSDLRNLATPFLQFVAIDFQLDSLVGDIGGDDLADVRGHTLRVLLLRRANSPFQSARALPAGFGEIDEDLGSTTAKPISIDAMRSNVEGGTSARTCALVGRVRPRKLLMNGGGST